MTHSEPWKPDVCIYHANCADGFAAAWAVWQRWGGDVEYVSAAYGDTAPNLRDIAGRHVLIVDFSYRSAIIREMSAVAASIIVLDHHKTAQRELSSFHALSGRSADDVTGFLATLSGVVVEFDMEQSGAALAWRFCHPNSTLPPLIRYVQDRDLWRFAEPYSREVSAYLSAQDESFVRWSEIDAAIGTQFAHIRETGRSLVAKQRKDIAAMLASTTRLMVIAGHTVPVANLPPIWASEAGNILAKGVRFAGSYYINSSGHRVFSLRSDEDGADVSEIAAAYGGGGHKHAAGFQMPGGWDGDV